MSMNVTISNGGKRALAKVHTSSDDENGLLVFAKNRDEIQLQTKPFINSTYGVDMAQDGSSVINATENVHNGIDNTYWTASAVSGTWTFNSTAQARTGTRSIDATATINNDVAQIDRGSTLDLTAYDEVAGWIYITAWPTSGSVKDVELEFLDSGAALVGNLVSLSSYIDTTSFGAWQKFVIPISDFGATAQTIQYMQIRTRDVGGGAAPDYYIDDLDILDLTSGGGIDYTITPDFNTRYHIERIKFFIADAYNVATSAQHAFAYDSLLGVSTLTNGILGARLEQEEIVTSATIRQLGDFMAFPQVQNIVSGGDGTNTWLSFDLAFTTEGGLVLDSKNRDSFIYRVRDDLSGLLKLQALAEGYIVTNEPDGY